MAYDFFHSFRVADAVKTVEHWKKAAGIPNPFAAQKSDIDALQLEIGQLRLQVAVLYGDPVSGSSLVDQLPEELTYPGIRTT